MTTPIKEYGPHPVSEIFSRFRMKDEEQDALGADIKANGLKEPIWLFEDKILDGNNRYRAGLKIGYRFKEADYRLFDPKVQGDPLSSLSRLTFTADTLLKVNEPLLLQA